LATLLGVGIGAHEDPFIAFRQIRIERITTSGERFDLGGIGRAGLNFQT